MIDQEEILNVDKIVFDDTSQERKSWTCLRKLCCRSLTVFLSQHFVTLLIIFGCFGRIPLSKTCDKSIVCVGILCSAAGWTLQSTRLWTSYFLWKIASLYPWWVCPRRENHNLFTVGSNWNLSTNIWQTLLFLINTLSHFTMLCKERLKISSLFKV